jgi:hypothetical protein
VPSAFARSRSWPRSSGSSLTDSNARGRRTECGPAAFAPAGQQRIYVLARLGLCRKRLDLLVGDRLARAGVAIYTVLAHGSINLLNLARILLTTVTEASTYVRSSFTSSPAGTRPDQTRAPFSSRTPPTPPYPPPQPPISESLSPFTRSGRSRCTSTHTTSPASYLRSDTRTLPASSAHPGPRQLPAVVHARLPADIAGVCGRCRS